MRRRCKIVANRPEKGFADLSDFGHKLDPKSVNKRTLENLISAGAFDTLVPNRAQVLDSMEQIIALANRRQEEKRSGQNDMFAAVSGPEPVRLKPIADFDIADRLARELASVGFYLSAHPLDEYQNLLTKLRVKPWLTFEEDVRKGAPVGKLAGTIVSKQERNTKTGKKMAILNISDASGQYEAVCFSETLEKHRDDLEAGSSVVLIVAAEDRPEGVNVRIQSVEPLDRAASNFSGAMSIFIKEPSAITHLQNQLPLSDNGHGGIVSIFVFDENSGREVEVKLGGKYTLTPKLSGALKAVPGIVDVELH